MRPGARVAPGRSPNNANPVDSQSANRMLVTITEDTQQPSITKPAQKPGRPTSICKRRLTYKAITLKLRCARK